MSPSVTNEIRIPGLIVRTIDIGESDRLLIVLTGELGKLSVFAKGVRNIKSHRLSSTQLFCYSEMVLHRKGDRYLLGETFSIEDFYTLREDLPRLSLAEYVTDVISHLTIEGDDQSEILRLTLNTLYLLSAGEKSISLIKAVFELRLAALLGFSPELSECRECQKKDGTFALIPEDGQLICSDCLIKTTAEFPKLPAHIPLSSAVLSAMRYVLSVAERRIFAFSLSDADLSDFSNICEKYLLCHIQRSFDTLAFYKMMVE